MRYLTKSRFKLGLECPTKLFYTKKPEVYADNKIDDPFLEALAKGGFQVGELAKLYYPGGIEIEGLDYDKTWIETQEQLKKENVILYEAAIKFNNLFVRVDVLKKTGNRIELIEAKSKSFNGSSFLEELWMTSKLKKGEYQLYGHWMPYIYDVAFQTYVAKMAFPKFEIVPFLMCADKDTLASVNGLNQKFLISKDKVGRTKIKIMGDTSLEALGASILSAIDISDVIEKIHNNVEQSEKYKDFGFKESVEYLATMYEKDKRIDSEVDNKCKKCEFRTNKPGLKSGFNECWKTEHNLTDEELVKPFFFDVAYRLTLKNPKIFMEDIDENDLNIKARSDKKDGLSQSERQWLQIERVKNNDNSEEIDKDGLQREFSTHIFPLHFIDFETSMVAIPFNVGKRPYEQTAFQFSHHIMEKDGSYRHEGEWISTAPGQFPNFDFIRALKKQLETDTGTIFRYSHHENTVLNQILCQLNESSESDREELISWIKTITHSGERGKKDWVAGNRDMVDLCDIVKRFYYNPETKGSNSIKYVLPAILKMQDKNPDPYGSLPPIFDGFDGDAMDLLMMDDDSMEDEGLRNGGAAMMAYALMQFTEMGDAEREQIRRALLRYCQLDTEAMVWIYQYLAR